MNNSKNKIVSSFVVLLGLVFAFNAEAARMQLSPFSINFGGSATDIAGFVVGLYKFLVGIAGIAAVGMIVAGGVLYATSSVVNKKGEGLDMIKSAVIGLILLLGSYVIIITINPNLLKLGTLSLPPCEGMTGAKPGQNCLPKIVAPVLVLCTGGKDATVTVPDPKDPTKQIQVPEEPGVNCKEKADSCIEAFKVSSQKEVLQKTNCDPGFVYEGAEDSSCKDGKTKIAYTSEEARVFCDSDISVIVDDFCGNNSSCDFTIENATFRNCNPNYSGYNQDAESYWPVNYQICKNVKDKDGNKRYQQWPFYKKGESPGTAKCMIWIYETKVEIKEPPYYKWEKSGGDGKAPDGHVAC